LIAGLVLIYFLPTMIGIIGKVESLGLLIFLNMLPTGVGWLAAMVMAFMLPRREPPLTYIRYQYPSPVSAGSERQLVNAAHGQAAILAVLSCRSSTACAPARPDCGRPSGSAQ
jgi:hypothetical protein